METNMNTMKQIRAYTKGIGRWQYFFTAVLQWTDIWRQKSMGLAGCMKPETRCDEFYRQMDVTLMGRRTFEEIEKMENPAACPIPVLL